jgi:CheY-like chemotaxis protein
MIAVMNDQILLIEDDPLVALMLEGYLEALGREVAGCAEDNATGSRWSTVSRSARRSSTSILPMAR